MTRARVLAWIGLSASAALSVSTGGISAQIDQGVAEVGEGTVRFAYATRPGVEICDQGVHMGTHQIWWRSRGDGDDQSGCRVGLAEVELRVRSGLVRGIELVRDRGDRGPAALDLGEVSAAEAGRFLLSLAHDGATGDAAKEAILPAMLADVEGLWRELLVIARDRTVDEDVRKSTLFWLGQEAAEAATAGLTDVALDEGEEQEIRDSAIFALSQRPDHEAVPLLMELARTGDQAETRKTAMFWLAQSDDERVVRFFEEILLGRIR